MSEIRGIYVAERLAALPPRMVGIAAIVILVVLHLPTLTQPLLEAHSFRQTQTAFTALIYHETGIDLLHPELPVLGAPWEVPFEFPLFQAMASLVMDAGLAPDVALRSTALVTFVVTAVLVWQLTGRLAGKAAGLVGLIAFLVTPLALLWSRASMIEYLATAAGVAFVLFTLEWHERQRRALYAVAMAAGTVVVLVKATTAAVYILPVLAIPFSFGALRSRPPRSLAVHAIAMLLLVAVPLGLGLLWTRHADAVKAASDFTSMLTSSNLATWNFGTLAQKLSIPDWASFLGRWNDLSYGGAIWLWTPLALIGAMKSKRRAVSAALVASAWIGPVLFTNLYFVHDYYLAAISPLVAIGIGLAAGWLWARRPSRSSWSIAAVLALLWVVQLAATQGYWMVQFEPDADVEDALVAARQIEADSAPDELVVVTGREWSPAALYYARRRGLMFLGSTSDSLATAIAPAMVRRLQDLGYSKIFHCPWKASDGCLRIIELPAVGADLDVAHVVQGPPEFLDGATIDHTGARCNMETLDGVPWADDVLEVDATQAIDIAGWAVDGERGSLAEATWVRLQGPDGTAYYAQASRVDRPDVASYLEQPGLREAGYAASFLPGSVPAGEYEAVVVMDTQGSPLLCDSGRRLRIIEPL